MRGKVLANRIFRHGGAGWGKVLRGRGAHDKSEMAEGRRAPSTRGASVKDFPGAIFCVYGE